MLLKDKVSIIICLEICTDDNNQVMANHHLSMEILVMDSPLDLVLLLPMEAIKAPPLSISTMMTMMETTDTMDATDTKDMTDTTHTISNKINVIMINNVMISVIIKISRVNTIIVRPHTHLLLASRTINSLLLLLLIILTVHHLTQVISVHSSNKNAIGSTTFIGEN